MARAWRSVAILFARAWRAAPWLLLGSILLALGVLGATILRGQIDPAWRWAALAAAAIAPLAALLLDPPHRRRPGRVGTLVAFGVVIALVGHVTALVITARVNAFYSAALLTEGALLMMALHGVQALLRRVSAPPDSAAPRAADGFVDGVRVLLLAFLGATAANLLPLAAVAFLLGLGFIVLAVVFRAPGAVAQLTRTE